MFRLGLDIDGCITEYPRLFSILTKALISSNDIEIFIISSRKNSDESRRETISELKDLEISFDHLILSSDKQKEIKDNKIYLFIDNEIENFIGINPDTCCLLVRESMNYCWKSNRFLGSKKTVRLI